MPHDKNGMLLSVGDEVILRCKITQVSEGETACNVTAEAAERPIGEEYVPSIAGNSRFYERVPKYIHEDGCDMPPPPQPLPLDAGAGVSVPAPVPFISTGANPPGIPCGLVMRDGVWQNPLVEHEIIANKQLRVAMDALIQTLKSLPTSRERALVITKLQEGVMWLGMDLKRLGTPNPYPNSKDTSNSIVDPTADGLTL